MFDIVTKKTASLLLVALVAISGLGLGFFGAGVAQATVISDVAPQQEVLNVCDGDYDEFKSLLQNLVGFVLGGAAIGAVVLAIIYKGKAIAPNTDMGQDQSDWTTPVKGVLTLYVVAYGLPILMDVVFGLSFTCVLPGFG